MTDTAAILARHVPRLVADLPWGDLSTCVECGMEWGTDGCDAHQLGVALHKEGALAYQRKHEARAANTNRELAEMRAEAAEAREQRLRAALDAIFTAYDTTHLVHDVAYEHFNDVMADHRPQRAALVTEADR